LRHRRAAHPALRRLLGIRVENEEHRKRIDAVALLVSRVLGLFDVEGEPDELSGAPLEGFVREDVRPHRAARVSPGRPGLDEEGNVFRARSSERPRVVIHPGKDLAGGDPRKEEESSGERERGETNGSHGGDRSRGAGTATVTDAHEPGYRACRRETKGSSPSRRMSKQGKPAHK